MPRILFLALSICTFSPLMANNMPPTPPSSPQPEFTCRECTGMRCAENKDLWERCKKECPHAQQCIQAGERSEQQEKEGEAKSADLRAQLDQQYGQPEGESGNK